MEHPSDTNQSPPAARRPSVRSKTMRIFNTRLLVKTLIAAAVIGPAAYFWYAAQVKWTAEAMLERAEKLVEEKDDASAAQYYFQYLKLRPDDAGVQVLLAETFDRAVKDAPSKVQAVEYYYQAIGVAPADKRRPLHRRLAELLIELRRFVPAEEEARELLELDQNDPQGRRLLALALYGQSRSGAVGRDRDSVLVSEALQRARELNPGDAEIAGILANVYRHQPQLLGEEQQGLSDAERRKLADQVVDNLVAASPDDAKALLTRYRYRTRYRLPEAKNDLAAALDHNPDDLEVVLQAAYQARRDAESAQREGGEAKDVQAYFEQARKHYEHAIEISPSEEPAYLWLGELYARQGKPDRAVETWRRGLEKGNKESIDLNSRLAGLLIAQGRLDEADKTLGGLERTTERIGPMLPPPAKLALKRSNDSLRAKWLVRKGRYLEAIPLLRRVAVGRQSAAAEVARSLQAWQWLGVAYSAIGQWDQAALAYEQATALGPKMVSPRLQAAAAWAMAGRPDAAETCYEQALSLDAAPETWIALARARFQREVRAPRAARNWDSFDKALVEAKKSHEEKPFANAWRLKLLEADYLVARGRQREQPDQAIRDAVELCRAAEREYPDAAGLWRALVAAYERIDRPADADRVLKRLEGMKGQAGVACLLQARLQTGREQYERARKTLTAGLETLPDEMRPALRREFVRVALREGRPDQMREQLLELHQQEPTNLKPVIRLVELAFEAGKFPEIERWEKELRKLEGPDGLFWRFYQARRLLAEARGPDDAKLIQASKLQTFIQNQRPAWPKAYLLLGLLSEARGKFERAAEAYQEAVRLGERLPLAYQRLVSLLLQMDRVDEADHYLLLMQDQIAPSETLSSLEMVVAARRGQIDRALETARRGVQQRPEDPIARLWLGQMLLAGDKIEDAETTLKKAVELAPGDTRTLGGLFGFYIRTNRPTRARETLQEIIENEKLSETQRASILARGYELLGDWEQAKANYRKAARLDADDAAAQLRLARYLLRTSAGEDRSEPEQLLRGVLERWPDSSPARWMLAELLVERGGEQQWQEAQRLVEEAGKDRTVPEVGRRVQAMLLTRRGGKENLAKAKQILEELVVSAKKAVASDRQWLARLYEIDGKVESARRQYLKLVTRENPSAAHLASYVELLLRHDLFDEADPWLKKLEALLPDKLGTTTLRAHWLRGKGQSAKIEPLVEALAEKFLKDLAKNKPREAELSLRVGNLYSTVDQNQAAERWYRRLVALAPERYEPLASALARQGRTREAVELCRGAAISDTSTRPALILAVVLLTGNPSAEDFQLAEPMLAKAAADHKDDVDLLSALAGVRVVQQRIDEATGLFRRVLTLKPTDVATLNNLATLLAEQPGKRQEALEYIERAIRIVGPQPGLLDTKGMIFVFEDKPDEAVPLLEEAAATPQADPRYHFHLAVAYDRAGEAEKARAAFLAARKGNLTRQVLTPLDRQMLADLEKKFD